MQKILVSEPIYKSKLLVVWDCKVSELPDLFPDIDSDYEYIDDRVGSYFNNDDMPDIIWTQDIKRMDIVVHELLHFVFAKAKEYWFEVDGGEEFYCYLLDYYYAKINKKILQHNK